MNQHKVILSYQSEGGTIIVRSDTIEGELSPNLEVEIPGGTTDKEITLSIPIDAKLIAFAFGCSRVANQDSNLTFTGLKVKTQTTGATAVSGTNDIFNITPQNGVCWTKNDPTAVPLTVIVTKLYVSNAGTAKGNLVGRVLIDPTP